LTRSADWTWVQRSQDNDDANEPDEYVAARIKGALAHDERVAALDIQVHVIRDVPNTLYEDVLGVRDAHLATFGSVQTGIVDSGTGSVRLGVVDPSEPPEPGSDAAVLAAGYASLTPLRPLCAALELVAAVGG